MNFFAKKKVFVRAAVLLGAIAFAEASVLPSLNTSYFGDSLRRGSLDPYKLNYVVGILKESITGLSAIEEDRLAEVILGESEAYSVDPLLVMAVIKTESTFYNWARSYKGAMGLMQLLPSTGRWMAEELDLEWKGDYTLYDPFLNVRLGIHYFSTLKGRYKDDTVLTLAAYNSGPTNLASLIRSGATPPKRYANKVLANYKDLRERAGYN